MWLTRRAASLGSSLAVPTQALPCHKLTTNTPESKCEVTRMSELAAPSAKCRLCRSGSACSSPMGQTYHLVPNWVEALSLVLYPPITAGPTTGTPSLSRLQMLDTHLLCHCVDEGDSLNDDGHARYDRLQPVGHVRQLSPTPAALSPPLDRLRSALISKPYRDNGRTAAMVAWRSMRCGADAACFEEDDDHKKRIG